MRRMFEFITRWMYGSKENEDVTSFKHVAHLIDVMISVADKTVLRRGLMVIMELISRQTSLSELEKVLDGTCIICTESFLRPEKTGCMRVPCVSCDTYVHSECFMEMLRMQMQSMGQLECPICRRSCLSFEEIIPDETDDEDEEDEEDDDEEDDDDDEPDNKRKLDEASEESAPKRARVES